MKKRTILFTAIALFMMIVGMGCEKEIGNIPSEIIVTWKLVGFGNTENNSFREAEPKDCEDCYTIILNNDASMTGVSCSNNFFGTFEVAGQNFNFSDFNLGGWLPEFYNGEEFINALTKVNSYKIDSNQLKLYYNKTSYLLFNKK